MVDDPNRLSDEELSALTSAESFADDLAGMAGPTEDSDANVKVHSLVTEDTTIGINLAAIDMITERFTRHVRLGLTEVLRTNPRITADRVKTVTFSDYLGTLQAPLSVNTIRMSGLRGTSMVIIDPNVIFAALDNFFGGFGRGIDGLPPGRMFTPTETRIINIMLDVIFASLGEAWAPICAGGRGSGAVCRQRRLLPLQLLPRPLLLLLKLELPCLSTEGRAPVLHGE